MQDRMIKIYYCLPCGKCMEATRAFKTTAASVLFQPRFRRWHVLQTVGTVVGVHLSK